MHFLPALFEPNELESGVAVVIDVLRATSTIVHALEAGVESISPCGEIDEARQIASRRLPGTVLLGGERGGLKIPGFDLGNSPAEYRHDIVAGRNLIFTTTNGTRAFLSARQARRVFAGALSNLSAVVRLLVAESGPVHLVCAGTDGHITLEDVLCAGAIADGLDRATSDMDAGDDATRLAVNLFETSGREYDRVLATLRASRGGRNLIGCGLEADIVACAEQDRFDMVPELLCGAWEIRAAANAP